MANRLTYRHIEAIRAVMLSGSVTGAAASLHVTQPAISHLLREIDDLLQFALFDRRAGRLIPTERAALLLAEIERSFIGLDSINDVCTRLKVAQQRTITVALVPVVSVSILPTVIAEYRRSVSGDFFMVDSVSNEQVLGQIAARKADIGIALETTPVPGVRGELLMEFEARCLLPQRHALAGRRVVTTADLDGLPMIGVPRADHFGDPIAALFAERANPPIQVVECAGATGACAMVEAGVGFALLDPVAAYPFRDSTIWFARFEPRVTFRFFVYWLEGRGLKFDLASIIGLARRRCEEVDRLCISPPDAAARISSRAAG
jgi:DNA-binding transcriptional LysR family regulator